MGYFRALTTLGASTEAVVWADQAVDATRHRLLANDEVLVWVNPITNGRDRTVLDAALREVAAGATRRSGSERPLEPPAYWTVR
jgi:hypothetical protein